MFYIKKSSEPDCKIYRGKKRVLTAFKAFVLSFLALGSVFLFPANVYADVYTDDAVKATTADQLLMDEFLEGNLLFFRGGIEDDFDEQNYLLELGMQSDLEGGQFFIPIAARVVGDNIRVRKTADEEGEILFLLNEDMNITVTDQQGDWYKIEYGIITGFCHKNCIFLLDEIGLNGTIMRDGTTVHPAPDEQSDTIATLKAGNGIQVTDYLSDWYMIKYQGFTGYAKAEDINLGARFTEETELRELREGMSGEAVVKMQNELKRRSFFAAESTGYFGSLTSKAVKDFQKAAKVYVDGVAGPHTLGLLYSKNNIVLEISDRAGVRGRVQLLDWNTIKKLIPVGATFKVIDVNTGISWNERRLGGSLHIDTEPVTKSDTAKLKQVYGGKWSWNRRAVWVVYKNKVYAASMNGMPHAGERISDNNFNGHHCIHFYKSRVHHSQKECPVHQSMVRKALNVGNG